MVEIVDLLGIDSDGAMNTFTFLETMQSLAGAVLVNWETVNIDASNVTLTDGTLITGNDTGYGLFLKNSATLNSPATLALIGNVDIDASSTLNLNLGGDIIGHVTNAGLIYWQNLNHTLKISGNYVGIAGSNISLETVLGDDTSLTDKMHVTSIPAVAVGMGMAVTTTGNTCQGRS
ncbi:hypothetical protein [Sulfurospirillum deleyianum]|uniref:hypothetical protein n=1 Tax=Sulfurospirillum deleyianum TaxID=65553 RepID=UPI0002DED871|nr:hypothetical protein [Sulfurospirillum deleyianum]